MAEKESAAVRVAREFRQQLVRNEDEALRRMSRYWVKMERSLEPRFYALAQEIKDLRDSGQPVPPQLIYTHQRYMDLMAQIMEEIPDYEKNAVDIITEYQIENYNLGLEDASAVIRASKPSDPVWNVVGKDAAETMAGFAGNGAPLAELMRHDYGELGATITDALVKGIGLGKGASAVAKELRNVMGTDKAAYARSARVARTEINRAYRIANQQQYAASGVVTKVLRLCYPPTACLACLEMDGEVCPNGLCEDHPNGKCTTIAVTVGGNYPQWQRGHDWLMEQSEEDQRRIIGDGRFEMWRNGVPLRDMVEMKPNAVWGGSPQLISERELREKLNITGANKMLFAVPQPSFSSAYDDRPKDEPTFLKKFVYEGPPEFGDQVYKYVNPGYKTGETVYKENCQRCVVADEMQWRGYDVVAQAVNKKDPVDSRVDTCFDIDWDNYKNDPFGFKLFDSKSTLKKDIKDAFKEWGQDARAILRIKWKRGGGHFVTIRKDDGNIVIEDPQIGVKYDIDRLKTNLTSTRFTNWLMRVDNRPLTENVDYAVKNREK